MSWNKISERVLSNLKSINTIREVHEYEAERFNGYPACVIVPQENASTYETTTENERVYAFRVTLHQEIDKRKPERAEEILRNVCDDIIDKFDKDYYFKGISLPTGYTMLRVEALPSAWGWQNRETLMRVADIIIKVHVSIDINQIS